MLNENFTKLIRVCAVIGTAALFLLILKYTIAYIYPFFLAAALAMILNPLVTFMEEKIKYLNRSLATLLVMAGFFGLFSSIAYLFINKILSELRAISSQLPDKLLHLKNSLADIGQAVYEKLTAILPILTHWDLSKELDALTDDLNSLAMNMITNTLFASSAALSSVSYIFIIMIFLVLAVFMLTKDFYLFKSFIMKIIPANIQLKSATIIQYTNKSFMGLVKAQLLITIISATVIMAGLFLFKIENFFMIAMLIFFVDFIPYMGIGIIFIPWILYSFISGNYVLTIEITFLYMLVIMLRQIIEPRIIAKEIGIHPFIALSILFIGVQTMGLIGVFITPFILICVSAFYRTGLFHALYHYIGIK